MRIAALLFTLDVISCACAFLVGKGLALSMQILETGVVDEDCGQSVWGVPEGGNVTGGEVEHGADTATPLVGVTDGSCSSSAPLLLSSRLLVLLARSRLLLPECCAWVATLGAKLLPLAVGRNQRQTSSDKPSVSNTNLAGIPSSLHRTHAVY